MPEDFGRQPVPPQGSPGADLRRSVSIAAERIQEILDTAEHVAEGIQTEAKAEAERYLAQKRSEADELAESQAQRLEQALDPLRAQLRTIERTSAEMVSAVEAAIASTRGTSVDSPKPRPVEVEAEAETEQPEPESALELDEDAAPAPRKPVPVPAPRAYAGTGRGPDSAWEPEPPSRDAATARGAELRESAVIRATQLAISGSARSEIEAALREDFGFEDPRPIVDEVLGPA
jgi:hypothetical protein